MASAKRAAIQLSRQSAGHPNRPDRHDRSSRLAMTALCLIARTPMSAVMPELVSGIHAFGTADTSASHACPRQARA
jgi:hypothetical protein